MRPIRGLALVALLAACAEGRVAITVDVLSFIPEAERSLDYPAFPAGITGAVSFPVATAAVTEGFGGSSNLDSVRLQGTIDIANAGGSGSFELRIHADSQPDPYQSPPVVVIPGVAQANGTSTLSFDEALPPSVFPIFERSTFYLGLEVAFQASTATVGPGTVELRALRARLVAREDIF